MTTLTSMPRRSHERPLWALASALWIAAAGSLAAQVSLDGSDKIDQLGVNESGKKCQPQDPLCFGFTVVRDARRPAQWYYVPDRPRLVERLQNNQRVPEFALMRYEFPDPQDAAKTIRGGILQFAVSLALP